jgi:glycosyltransferase involved in cell wall biosynthesis
MKILIYSPLFYPSLGGIETVVSILASEFVFRGHEVKLVSQVPATDSQIVPMPGTKATTYRYMLKLLLQC